MKEGKVKQQHQEKTYTHTIGPGESTDNDVMKSLVFLASKHYKKVEEKKI